MHQENFERHSQTPYTSIYLRLSISYTPPFPSLYVYCFNERLKAYLGPLGEIPWLEMSIMIVWIFQHFRTYGSYSYRIAHGFGVGAIGHE